MRRTESHLGDHRERNVRFRRRERPSFPSLKKLSISNDPHPPSHLTSHISPTFQVNQPENRALVRRITNLVHEKPANRRIHPTLLQQQTLKTHRDFYPKSTEPSKRRIFKSCSEGSSILLDRLDEVHQVR